MKLATPFVCIGNECKSVAYGGDEQPNGHSNYYYRSCCDGRRGRSSSTAKWTPLVNSIRIHPMLETIHFCSRAVQLHWFVTNNTNINRVLHNVDEFWTPSTGSGMGQLTRWKQQHLAFVVCVFGPKTNDRVTQQLTSKRTNEHSTNEDQHQHPMHYNVPNEYHCAVQPRRSALWLFS